MEESLEIDIPENFYFEMVDTDEPKHIVESILFFRGDTTRLLSKKVLEAESYKKTMTIKNEKSHLIQASCYVGLDRQSVCIVCERDVHESSVFGFVHMILDLFQPKIVLSFSSLNIFSMTNLEGNRSQLVTEGALRLLMTESTKGYLETQPSLLKYLLSLQLLEVGNVILGIDAAITCYTNVRQIPCCIFMSLGMASTTISAAKVFESTIPLIEYIIHAPIQIPSTEDYKTLVKNDSFIMKTELLYT